MKFLFLFLCFFTMTAQANTFMTVKERLRISLWVDGIQTKSTVKRPKMVPRTHLPEELERALQKM